VLDAHTKANVPDSFDGVIANHMLYHVDDRKKAFSAIRSVLKDSGSLYAATNGVDHLRQLRALVQNVKATEEWSPVHERFSLENGGLQLNKQFVHAEVRRFDGELRVTDAQPLIDYVQSSDSMRLDDDQQRRFRAFIEQQISSIGSFRITTAGGMFVATSRTRE
jgi:SAM-dependent methyltransferase